ncbi:group II intron maturase-specific domain-containing protein [Pseudomonas aeruginosa]|nr:group II intron maturase-specific domain-containing protein [Pseudomonas aeruginosa]MCG0208585.1 hypothetical protein [Pseudomonas aeruginosa]
MARAREILRRGRDRALSDTIKELNPVLRGWANYFRLTANMRHLEELDGWLRRRLRCLRWRQWQTPTPSTKGRSAPASRAKVTACPAGVSGATWSLP